MFYNSMHDSFYDQYSTKHSRLLLIHDYISYDIKLRIFSVPKLEKTLPSLRGTYVQIFINDRFKY